MARIKLVMRRVFGLLPVLYLAASLPLPAQMGGGGIQLPSWGHKKKQQQQQSSQTVKESLAADGNVMINDGKKLVIAVDDGRQLDLKLTPETKCSRQSVTIAASAVLPRSIVHIEADADADAFLTATLVNVTKDPPVQEPGRPRAGATQGPLTQQADDGVRPTILGGPVDAPGRPILRHGIPKKPVSADDDVEETPAHSATASTAGAVAAPMPAKSSTEFAISGDEEAHPQAPSNTLPELVARTKDWTNTFTQGLPNYVCKQETTRYLEESKSAGWQAQDVVSATVIYEDGKESYRNIEVGGHKTNKKMEEIGGSTSTGEFASTLHSLFSDYSDAQFKMYQSTTMTGASVTVYDFKVALKHSDWTIRVGGQTLRPSYKGSVWIERNSAQVRRIEMEAVNIPKDFPLDTVQWAVDYDNVSLGTTSFLLPVHAENLGCQRGSSICSKNAIDFRDYHRYAGESTITFK